MKEGGVLFLHNKEEEIHRTGTNAGDKEGVHANFEPATHWFCEALMKKRLQQDSQAAWKHTHTLEYLEFTTLFRAVAP